MVCTLPLAGAQVIMRENIEKPLLEGDPFDLIHLDSTNDGAVLRIVPLENVPQPLPDEGELVFEYFSGNQNPSFKHLTRRSPNTNLSTAS